MTQTQNPSIKRIVFIERVHIKNIWTIPIELMDGRYITGQDLAFKKMIGKDPLTEEEKKKYPYVVNPENFYKIGHLKNLNMSNDYDKAMYNLIIASLVIASSKSKYDQQSVEFIGYFHDEEEEAVEINRIEDEIYEASTLIRDLPLLKYKGIVLLLNYLIKGSFFIPANVSPDVQRSKMLKACKDNPTDVKKCFPKYNKGVEKYSFILELIEAKIIRETTRGEFFYEKEYLGDSLDAIIRTLGKADTKYLKEIFIHRLKLVKGESIGDIPAGDKRGNDFKSKVQELKALIVDKDDGGFAREYKLFVANYSDMFGDEDHTEDVIILKEHMDLVKLSQERENLIDSFKVKSLTNIQKSFTVPGSPFKKDEVPEGVWDDKEKLIEHMVNIKLPNAK